MGKRETRRLEQQSAVLDAVIELLKDQGFESISIALIARQMGASVGGLYRYYSSKEAIYAALQLRALNAFDEHIRKRVSFGQPAANRRDALERIVQYAESWTTFRDRDPHLFTVLDQFLSSPRQALDSAGRELVDERLAPILDRLTTLLDTAFQMGALKAGRSEERTQLLWAAMHGIEHLRKRIAYTESGNIDVLRRSMLASLLHGWGAARGLVDIILPLD